ncbi:MAG: hypothetical protein J5825_02305 [Lachnospiraceae bacterium]|nr:hypothetical protein [Lachnospiraceae bacterium]
MSSQSNGKNIIRIKKVRRFNPIFIFLALVLGYIALIVYSYFHRTHLTPILVEPITISNSDVITGLIIRDEKVITSEAGGNINFYVQDGEKVGADSVIYTVDETGNFSELLSAQLDKGVDNFTTEQWYRLKDSLYDLATDYPKTGLSAVQLTKNRMNNQIISFYYDAAVKEISDSLDISHYQQIKMDHSSTVLFGTDGFENFKEEDLSPAMFDTSLYKKEVVNPGSVVKKGDPIYREVTDFDWYLYFPLNSKTRDFINRSSSYITLYLINEDIEVTVPVQIVKQTDGTEYMKCTFNNKSYGTLSSRYLNFRIVSNVRSGLKIPKSAVTEQKFYLIPQSFATYGQDGKSLGFLLVSPSNEVDEPVHRVETLYALVDGNYYVSMDVFSVGDYVVKEDSQEKYYIGPTDTLKGVFNVNKGYTMFRRIKVLDEINDYYMVAKGQSYSISPYDHVVYDADGVKEKQLVN